MIPLLVFAGFIWLAFAKGAFAGLVFGVGIVSGISMAKWVEKQHEIQARQARERQVP